MYKIRCDPDLGVSKAAIRMISCAYNFCIKQLELPWDKNEKDFNQETYCTNKSCLY